MKTLEMLYIHDDILPCAFTIGKAHHGWPTFPNAMPDSSIASS
jgi:hypothetical protein